jgi:kanamycin kinase
MADGSMVAGVPGEPLSVPAPVAAVAGGRSVRVVWRNEIGGVTFELLGPRDRWFVKCGPPAHDELFRAEAVRLRWAGAFTPVPEVLALGNDEEGAWLLTEGLPGDSAVARRWLDEPATAVRAIGEGLRALHDSLPVETCPFSWSAQDRAADARARARGGSFAGPRRLIVGTSVTLTDALDAVGDPPPIDRLVVCHGDACAPNTLIHPSGRWSAHVDLGALGLADRWADLAVATWSLEWNYGPGLAPHLLDAYEIDPDPERTSYYRLLWDLGP